MTENYFILMRLPVCFNVDQCLLQKRYCELQKEFHPDRLGDCSPAKRYQAVQYTAYINDAYQTLKDPGKRAVYLLGLQGTEIDIESTVIDDEQFLTEQLLWRERLEQLNYHDTIVKDIKKKIDARVTKLETTLVDLFAQEQTTCDLSAEIKKVVIMLQFFIRLGQQINRQFNQINYPIK